MRGVNELDFGYVSDNRNITAPLRIPLFISVRYYSNKRTTLRRVIPVHGIFYIY